MKRALLLLALLCLAPLPALAQTAPGEISVTVEDDTAESRKPALEAALEQALVRLSGRPGVAGEPLLEELLGAPQRYLQQFRYAGSGTEEDPLRLLVRFDMEALTRALVERGVAVWDPGRPPVLTWLAYETDQGRGLVAEGDDPTGVGAALQEAAAEIGLSVMFPLLDLQDQARVGYADVAGGFTATVAEASRRYGTPLVLVGRVRALADGTWRGRWNLLAEGLGGAWTSSGGDRGEVLREAMAALASQLRADYAVLPDLSAEAGLRLQVAGVTGLQGYADLESYLEGLTGVAGLTLETVDGDVVGFRLRLSQPRDRVLRELRRGLRLVPVAESVSLDPADPDADEQVWSFRVAP